MPPKSMPQEKAGGPSAATRASDMQKVMEEVRALQDVVREQQATISNLQGAAAESRAAYESLKQRQEAEDLARNATGTSGDANPLRGLKSPPIPVFSGKPVDCTSIKVKGFISNVKRVGMLSGSTTEDTLVQLAACHLQDKAAVWITRLEATTGMPNTLDELKDAMMRRLVPTNEKTRAISKLWSLKLSGPMDKHISDFLDLVDLAEASEKEAYNYFFNSLPGKYQKDFIREYSTGDFPSIQAVFEFARKLDFSDDFETDKSRYKVGQSRPAKGSAGSQSQTGGSSPYNAKTKRGTTQKDPDAVSWGAVAKGEGKMYRDADRCFKCGKVGGSLPDHPCRRENKGDTSGGLTSKN